jgi:virulence-associated protein VapD
MDTTAMGAPGISKSDRTSIYQTEIPNALRSCGFTAHIQGSLYHTEDEGDPLSAVMKLESALKTAAPNFCTYVRAVHVFRIDEWSDVTQLIADRPAAGPPDAEEEFAEQEDMAKAAQG